jgi:hypothetical protein
MATAQAMKDLYIHLGYNAYMTVTLRGEGFIGLAVFRELAEDEADSMIHILSCHTYLVVANIPDVTFPVRATVNVKALGFWLREQEQIGATPLPDDFTEPNYGPAQANDE